MARKPNSGVKSDSDPHRETFTDFRAKLLHGHREWKIMRLRELVEAERNEHRAHNVEMLQRDREAEFARFKALPPDERQRQKRHHAAVLKGLNELRKDAASPTEDTPGKRSRELLACSASSWNRLV